MLLDSTEFAYAYRRGWEDYFEPFCVAPDSVDPQRIETWFRFNPIEEREVFMSLLRSEPDRLRFGSTEIAPFEAIMRHFMRLIFRLKDDCVDEISRLTKRLELTERYVAIHVRRGDKVGDEDVAYAVERYFDALGPLSGETVFVMSDDYGAVTEVSNHLDRHCLTSNVATLCHREHSGFDIWKLRTAPSRDGRCPRRKSLRLDPRIQRRAIGQVPPRQTAGVPPAVAGPAQLRLPPGYAASRRGRRSSRISTGSRRSARHAGAFARTSPSGRRIAGRRSPRDPIPGMRTACACSRL